MFTSTEPLNQLLRQYNKVEQLESEIRRISRENANNLRLGILSQQLEAARDRRDRLTQLLCRKVRS